GCASRSLDRSRQPRCKRMACEYPIPPNRSSLGAPSLWHVGVPGAARFRRDLRKTHSRRRVRDAGEGLAGRALNLAAGKLSLALQALVAVGTVELEFVCVHSFYPVKRR